MNDREKKYVEAAMRAITRYGMKRTTMSDIAAEAGVSRQTLYSVYANKDEVLRATLCLEADKTLAAIEINCESVATLGEQLDVVFEHMALRPYKLMQSVPDPDDLIEGINAAGRDEIQRNNERFRKTIEKLLLPYAGKVKAADLNLKRLSDMIRRAISGFKHKAESRQKLASQLETLKQLLLTALKEK